MTILIALAVLPAVYLLLMIYRQDKIEKEPVNLLVKLFIFGSLSAFLAAYLENYATQAYNMLVIESDILYFTGYAFLVIAVIEEGVKFLVLKRFSWNNPAFNYRFDAIVYAVSVSLGFAALENIIYVLGYGASVLIPRALLAIPGHTAFAVFMGAYYGRAKLEFDKGNRRKSILLQFKGYIIAVLLHGFYDACLLVNDALFTSIFFGFIVLMYIVVIRKIKKESNTDTLV